MSQKKTELRAFKIKVLRYLYTEIYLNGIKTYLKLEF